MKNTIIDIKNLVFNYQNEVPLFNGFDICVKEGETIGLIGSNGAGKSTLLKLIVGLNDLKSGKIKVEEIDLCKRTLKEVRKKIGFAFQDAESQLFMTTVYEDVAFGPRNQGVSEDNVKSIVYEALAKVDALHLVDRPPYKLSGGEKRSVALATVLSMEPKVIVLDEPTTGLDPRARRNLIGILKGLPQTKIIATHDMDMALEICDRVVVLHHGQIMLDGIPKEVFKNSNVLDECHLEQPLTMQACKICSSKIS